jgi:hypothetical protein
MYRPAVVITQRNSGFEMAVDGMEESVRVRPVDVIEDQIKGTSTGGPATPDWSCKMAKYGSKPRTHTGTTTPTVQKSLFTNQGADTC